MTRRLTPRAIARTLFPVLLVAAIATGCSGDLADSADSGATTGKAAREGAADDSGSDSAGGSAGSGSSADSAGTNDLEGPDSGQQRTSARVLPAGRDMVYRGQITVRVRNLARAAARAEALALGSDGVVSTAETSRGSGSGESHLTLRVPPTAFTPTMSSLGRLGKELSRSRSAEDVTTELADTGSRVRSQQRSIARLQAMLGEAETIGEVVQVESELTRREADLESLQAQLARLEDVTDLATIEVTLVSPGTRVEPDDEDDLGFVAGLRGGWDAFVGIVLVALTVLGALVPFAVVLGIVGLPAYALLRSRRRPTAAESEPSGAS
jgi:hypothetical protein